jgi:hypothetical protein
MPRLSRATESIAMNPTALAHIREDAGLLLHAIDAPQRRALFVRIGEAKLRAAAFLDERATAGSPDGFWLPLRDLEELSGAALPAPRGFIFHIGHCGSTLLSRLLDRWPDTLGLREPRVLRDLAGLRDAQADTAWLSAQDWQRLFQGTIGLLGRRFRPAERVLVKATSSCNELVEPLLGVDADVRVVLMHMPLENYLATLLKAPSRLDALTFAPSRLAYLQKHFGADDVRLYRLDEVEVLALGWVVEMARFAQIAGGPDAARVMGCDFEDFLRDPAAQLAKIAAHLGLADAEAVAKAAVQSDAMHAYSKAQDHAYGSADRQHDLALAHRRFGAEIARGLRFAESLMARCPRLAELIDGPGRARRQTR